MRTATTTIHDGNAGVEQSVPEHRDISFQAASDNVSNLDEFFARPIEMAKFNWEVGAEVRTLYYPFNLFMSNPRIANRLNNYNVVRFDLCVKFLINGTPFHLGCLVASVYNMGQADKYVAESLGLATTSNATKVQDCHRPHVFIEPCDDETQCLEVPFFWPYNGIRNTAQVATLAINVLAPLTHLHGSTKPVTVTMIAWAKNVHLEAPTATNLATLTAQADLGGPVSRTSYAIARAMGSLATIPSIRPYALASQMTASAVGSIASLFGFSRPSPEVPKPAYLNVGDLAITDQHDVANKLTFNSNAEVTIDSSVTGVGSEKEMLLSHIVSQPSLIDILTWSGNSANGVLLARRPVDPFFCLDVKAPTNVAYASLPFRYWRGDLIYTFKFITSGAVRGRVKICWDAGGNSVEMNVTKTAIVDISQNKTFQFRVGWGAQVPYLPCRKLHRTVNPITDVTNGAIEVAVINSLSTPSSTTASIKILLFVSAAENYEVVDPSDNLIRQYLHMPAPPTQAQTAAPDAHQAAQTDVIGEVYDFQTMTDQLDLVYKDLVAQAAETEGFSDVSPNSPSGTNTAVITEKGKLANIVHFGDGSVSIRQLAKRYNLLEVMPIWDGSTFSNVLIHRAQRPVHPLIPGWVPNGAGTHGAIDSTAYDFNMINHTFLTWYGMMYLAARGGIKYKVSVNGATNGVHPFHIQVSRGPYKEAPGVSSTLTSLGTLGVQYGNIQYSRIIDFIDSGISGCAVADGSTTGTTTVEMPYHNQARFIFNHADNRGANCDGMAFNVATIFGYKTNDDRMLPKLMIYVAAADDFSLSNFVGAPLLFDRSDPQGQDVYTIDSIKN